MTPESCNLPICWAGLLWACSRGNTEGAGAGAGAAAGRRNCWNTFQQQQIRLKKQCVAYRVTSIPRQRVQKRFRSHSSEPRKHSKSEERYNSTVEGGDFYTARRSIRTGEFARRMSELRNYLTAELRRRQRCKIRMTVREVNCVNCCNQL
jgi:hypothetical protein